MARREDRSWWSRAAAFVTATVVVLAPSASRAEEPLSLEQALHLALTRNERALKAPLRIEAAEGSLDRARTAFYPTVLGQGAGVWSSIPDRGGRSITGAGTLTVNQPILNPSAFPLYGQAKHNLASERWGAAEDLRVLAFDTTNAFLSACSQEQLVRAAQQRVDRAKSDRDDSAARAAAGLASTNDVTRASVAVATAESQLANARGNAERALLSLSFLVGQPVVGSLVAPDRTTTSARRTDWNREDVVKNAEARRPDLRSATEHVEALRDFAKEPMYRLIPTLGIAGQIREIFDPLPTDRATSENVQLTLTWTIYDAGVRYADKRVRLAQAESGSLDERALRRSVATDIALALASLHAAREIFRIADEAVAAAQKNTEETAILYKQGLAKAIEVTDANASRYDADVTRATAKLTMEQAYLNLRYALGLGPIDQALPSAESAGGGAK